MEKQQHFNNNVVCKSKKKQRKQEDENDDVDLRRGPWTVDEDFTLIDYVAHHGEGRWNSLARHAGLKRTGKSCRLRWLNYLRPDVRRGNISLEEQLLILELHSRWGNRWSKIAQHLPGRTDNEIKNYWRTRVQKHAKQLKCDVNSQQFKDTMKYLWMPRLAERIRAAGAPPPASFSVAAVVHQSYTVTNYADKRMQHSYLTSPENSFTVDSSSFGTPVSDAAAGAYQPCDNGNYYRAFNDQYQKIVLPSSSSSFNQGTDLILDRQCWNMDGGDRSSADDTLWDNNDDDDDVWFLQEFSCNF